MRQRRSGTNRKPSKPYYEFAKPGRLDGVRIGVVREYMDKSLFSVADEETIDIVDRAIEDLRGLGATIVDPGPHGALFQECVDVVSPVWRNRLFIGQFPAVFPPGADHIPLLVDMYFDPSLVPHNANGQPSIRNLGSSGGDTGDTRYNMNAYLKGRGDPEIQTLTDMINKANFWTDPVIPNRRASLVNADQDTTFSNASALQTRFTLQAVVFQCFARYALDAVVYPTGNIPPQSSRRRRSRASTTGAPGCGPTSTAEASRR
jgi:amidase